MKELKFFCCGECGEVVLVLKNGCDSNTCCGSDMKELKANTTDAAQEKHVPVISVSGDKVNVKVGSVSHPMEDVHYIEWILIETDKGIQKKDLNPCEAPEAVFALCNEKLVAAYAYCNKHGLWKVNA